jgi:hypothetical protein
MTALTYLNLENNQISGSIPPLSNLTDLTSLFLGNNALTGGFPSSLQNLTSVTHIGLNTNQLSGTIPTFIGSMSALLYLTLENNQFTGEIPITLGDLSDVTHLGLGNNQLNGTIPSSVGNMTALTYLDLGNNLLSGQIPPSFVNLILLQELHLADNSQLTGLIPTIDSLTVLDFGGTSLDDGKVDSTTGSETVPTDSSSLYSASEESSSSQSPNVIFIVVAVLCVFVLALIIGTIIAIKKRRGEAKARSGSDTESKTTGDQSSSSYNSNSYQISKVYSEAVGNIDEYDADLVFITKINAGAFGEVWKGTHKGNFVAIKKMKFDKMPTDELAFIQGVVDEAGIMKEMRHEKVVQFIGFDFKTVSIIMELMPRGALSSFIEENRKTMRWSTRYQMMCDICEGMAYLHSPTFANGAPKKELFHQDLKSANVLLVAEGGVIRAKIGDFGLSCLLFIV